MGSLRTYLTVARLTFGQYATYRGATFAGAFTNTVFGFILASILRSTLGDRRIGGLDAATATTYTFVAQGLLFVVGAFGDFGLSRSVHSGAVAVELTRPWDWPTYRLAVDLGRSAFAIVFRGFPPAFAGWLVFRYPVPAVDRWIAFLIATLGAVVLASRFWTAVGVTSFWLVDGSGVVQFAVVVFTTCAGTLVPLNLFPAGLAEALGHLPFAAIVHRPIEVFLGLQSLPEALAYQAGWLVVLEFVLRREVGAAGRKLEIQGG